MTRDRFGNPIDPSVGYARGTLIRSSADEVRRLRHAQALAGARVAEQGSESIGIFTGNSRAFPLDGNDVAVLCEEWVGSGMFKDRLRDVAVAHLGGDDDDDAAVFNRTSAGIVAAILALSNGRPVVSVVPDGDRSHASVVRGCRLAGVRLVEVEGSSDCAVAIGDHRPRLVVVTSALSRLDDARTEAAVAAAKAAGAMRSFESFDPATLLDEARDGRAIADVLAGMFGDDVVHRSDLGPMIDEEDVHALVIARAGVDRTAIAPAEMTAALGILLLRDHGVLTTNTHGQPGGRVSLRLKPTPGAVARVGGAVALGDAVSDAMDEVAKNIGDPRWFARQIFGDDA